MEPPSEIPTNTLANVAQAIGDCIRAGVLSGSEMKGGEMPDQARERIVQYAILALRIMIQREPTEAEVGLMLEL